MPSLKVNTICEISCRINPDGRKDAWGNEPLPLRNVQCTEPPKDSWKKTWPIDGYGRSLATEFVHEWRSRWTWWQFRRSWNWNCVEFVSYTRVMWDFQENLKAWESEILLVACLGFSACTLGLTGDKITLLTNSIAFIIKLRFLINFVFHCWILNVWLWFGAEIGPPFFYFIIYSLKNRAAGHLLAKPLPNGNEKYLAIHP